MSFANYLGYPLPPGGTGGAGSTFTYLTCADELANLPDSVRLLEGAGVSFTYGLHTLTINATSASGGLGTVTSVGLSMPAGVYSVANSPVTSSATLTVTFVAQGCGTALMGPISGANATPAFRNIVALDISSIFLPGKNVTLTDTATSITIDFNDPELTFANISGNTTLTANSAHLIYADASGGNMAVTLPAASISCTQFMIKKVDTSTHSVTIQRAGSDLIDLASSLTLVIAMQSVNLSNDTATNWWVS